MQEQLTKELIEKHSIISRWINVPIFNTAPIFYIITIIANEVKLITGFDLCYINKLSNNTLLTIEILYPEICDKFVVDNLIKIGIKAVLRTDGQYQPDNKQDIENLINKFNIQNINELNE